jgi:hypothetical protein
MVQSQPKFASDHSEHAVWRSIRRAMQGSFRSPTGPSITKHSVGEGSVERRYEIRHACTASKSTTSYDAPNSITMTHEGKHFHELPKQALKTRKLQDCWKGEARFRPRDKDREVFSVALLGDTWHGHRNQLLSHGRLQASRKCLFQSRC